ncbi:MAG: hypothetical protein ACRC1W_07275, partial [Shewanella sp.]
LCIFVHVTGSLGPDCLFGVEDEPYFTDEVLPPLADTKANSLRLLFKAMSVQARYWSKRE